MSDTQGKSFAERFASKKTFTSQKLEGNAAGVQPSPISEKKSAIDPIKRSQADLIYLVKGIDNNREAWYYVLVERTKLQLFLKALNDDIIHLEKYGQILYSAYGSEPPAEITNKLKEEYGI